MEGYGAQLPVGARGAGGVGAHLVGSVSSAGQGGGSTRARGVLLAVTQLVLF
jgi:hypothetical protein